MLTDFGFKEEWLTDPILLTSNPSEIINIGCYEKQDFTLETFYNLLKEKINIPGEFISEDGETFNQLFEDC